MLDTSSSLSVEFSFRASANALPDSLLRRWLALTFSFVIALMANEYQGQTGNILEHTYWHLGRKAASMMAPEACRSLPLKSASVMDVSMVTGLL